MKSILIFVSISIIFINLTFCQSESDDTNDWLSDSSGIEGFVCPILSFEPFNDDLAFFLGGGGALIFYNKFLFGGYGIGMRTNTRANKGIHLDRYLDFMHGGLWLGWRFIPLRRFHPVFSLQAGVGGINVSKEGSPFPLREFYDRVWMLTPYAEFEFDINRYLKVSCGGTYSAVYQVDLDSYSNEDFSGAGFFVTLKFGMFDFEKKE